MDRLFDERLSGLANSAPTGVLRGGRRGLEKESLRVAADGSLSRRGHPVGLGSALTNKFITTDFSEALLEFVTPALPSTWAALRCLCEIHQYTYQHINDELLWVSSMPCLIGNDGDIPLARYGTSNVGQMKTIYRRGLGYRYGRAMQTIAGLHFNYSLPDEFWPVYQDLRGDERSIDEFRSAEYLGMIRNFRRMGWLVLYLFGASPAVCRSFAADSEADLEVLDKDTLYLPFATSLRMSDIGYSNKTQAGINISLNHLEDYISGLSAAIDTPEPDYEAIGVKVDGKYRQLSTNKLQIENEYYSSIRPKRVAWSGERPTSALRRGGIEYVEVRSIDLGLSDPVGINQNTMRFIEAFLVYCLLRDSPHLHESEWHGVLSNHAAAARSGRDPGLELDKNRSRVGLRDWAREILEGVAEVAAVMDAGADPDYTQAVQVQMAAVEDPDKTPSARILKSLRDEGMSFFRFAQECATRNRDYFAELVPLTEDRQELFDREARESLERQQQIEAADEIDFEEYLANYYRS